MACVAAAYMAPSARAEVVLEVGHVDAVAPVFTDGQLAMKVKDGTGASPVFRDAGEALFRVKAQARTTVPSGLPPAFAFMGTPGSTIWLLPQVQSDNPDVVWAGWSSETIPAGQFEGDLLQWRLVGVDGPGPVQLYETDTFGSPRVIFDSADGLPDAESKATGTHSHFNWVFRAAGLHRLRFEVSGTPLGSGVPVTTGPVEYRFEVVGSGGGSGGGQGGGGSGGGQGGGSGGGLGGGAGGGQAGGADDPRRPAKFGARVARARSGGRTVILRLRVTRPSRATVAVLRGGRVIARSKARTVGVRRRQLRVKLDRRLAPGRYRLRVIVRGGGKRVVRHVPLRVPPRRAGAQASTAPAGPAASAATPALARLAASGATVLDDGHVDYGAKLVDGRLQSLIKDGTKSANDVVWREPSETVFHVVAAAETELPRGGALDFLGAPGSRLWMIPQVQRQGVLWAGWNTEDSSLQRIRGAVTWRLLAVDGPGAVAVFQTGSFGQPDVIFDSADGVPDSYRIPLGVHAHGNWAFTAEGVYRMRFAMTADVAGRRQTDTETLTVVVGDGDPSAVDPAAGSDTSASAPTEPVAPGGDGSAAASATDPFAAGDEGWEETGTDVGGGDGLPHTGAELLPVAGGGLVLIALGATLRRRSRPGRVSTRP